MADRSNAPRALVTGLRGFTGNYLAQELAAVGYRVFGLVNRGEPEGPGIYSVNLCDRQDLAKAVQDLQPDVVAHLAAVTFVAHGDVDEIYRTNVVGSHNLLEALAGLNRKPSKILLASSANIYGNSAAEMIDESAAPNPTNDYSVSKLAMEYMARLWIGQLPIFITRPFNYTGVGQSTKFLLPKIVDHFQRGERVIELGNLDVERDFSDVRFVVAQYVELLQKASAGEVFNICSGRSTSLRSIIDMMERIAGYRIDVRVNPSFVRSNEVSRLRGNPAKLVGLTGLQNDIPLQETLRWMFSTTA